MASSPMPLRVYTSDSLDDAVRSRMPRLITDASPWPVSIDPAAWTAAGLAATVPSLGPVRIGNRSSSEFHEYWNVDMGVAAAEEANANGFRLLQLVNETAVARMLMAQFWEPRSSAMVHYYSGSLLEPDGRASLPALQRGLDELVATIGRSQGSQEGLREEAQQDSVVSRPAARHFLKVWLGTDGATTPLHYDTQHNVYAQLHGAKDFWLLPPFAVRRGDVHLYPRIHPLSHFVRGLRDGENTVAEALNWDYTGQRHACFEDAASYSGRCMMHIRLGAGAILYLPPFWLHRASCRSASCVSTNVWVPSREMHRMQAIEEMPLPFESDWALPTRHAAVLAFLRAMLDWVHTDEEDEAHSVGIALGPSPPPGPFLYPTSSLTPVETVERLLSTRWWRAEDELLRARQHGPSRAQQTAAAAECVPPSGGDGGGDNGVNLTKIDEYARRRAVALGVGGGRPFNPALSWFGPKLILLHDQLERIAHWATDGDAMATHALLHRLRHCCERLAARPAVSRGPTLAGDDAPPRERQTAARHDEL